MFRGVKSKEWLGGRVGRWKRLGLDGVGVGFGRTQRTGEVAAYFAPYSSTCNTDTVKRW